MAKLFSPRNLAVAGGVGAIVYLLPSSQKPNVFETPATKAIGQRHAAGGASSTHTTAVATALGDPNNNVGLHEKDKGAGTRYYRENIADQRPDRPGAPGNAAFPPVGKEKLNEAVFGKENPKGK